MPVTITSELQRDAIMASALDEMVPALLSLNSFSTAFRDVKLEGTNKMQVPYYPLEASASKNFIPGTGYEFGDSYTQGTREVTINKRKYQPLSISSVTHARQPQLNPEKIGAQKGRKLAADVLEDILSIVTAANFGAAAFTGDGTLFDFAALNETVGVICDNAGWPKEMRSAVLKSAYYRNLVTDLSDASAYQSDGPVKRADLVGVAGFDVYNNQNIPSNAENLVGFAAYESAILVGFSPVAPKDEKRIVDYSTMTHEESGLTLEYRTWFDPTLDEELTVIEVNYGFGIGQASALKRIISSVPV